MSVNENAKAIASVHLTYVDWMRPYFNRYNPLKLKRTVATSCPLNLKAHASQPVHTQFAVPI